MVLSISNLQSEHNHVKFIQWPLDLQIFAASALQMLEPDFCSTIFLAFHRCLNKKLKYSNILNSLLLKTVCVKLFYLQNKK